MLKSVTVRSKSKIYKQKIAVADTTTFSTLISFAIKVSPPAGKQFVIRTADGALEYMLDDLAREVILKGFRFLPAIFNCSVVHLYILIIQYTQRDGDDWLAGSGLALMRLWPTRDHPIFKEVSSL